MVEWLKFLQRILEAIANVLNRNKKDEYADNSADTIANGGSVQHSDQTFSDLADKSKRD